MSRRRALNPVGGVILTVLIILAAAVLAFVLLTFAGTLIALRHNMRPGEAMDLTTSNLDGTRFEKYAERVVRDVEELRALPWEDVCISSFDGLRLHGRLIRGEGDTVILVHGYHSSAENDFAGIAQWYVRRGCTVLAVDQRSHGRSEGRSVTFGYRERRDAVAWAQFAEYELGSERVWMHGVSMGAVSVLLALEDGYPDCVRGVIADCPFDSPVGLFAFHLRKRFHLPPFPVVPIGTLAWALMIGPDFVKDSCHAAAAESALPLLLFSAGEDKTVPPRCAEAVWEARGRRDVWIHMPGAHHALCWQEDAEQYASALESFLSSERTAQTAEEAGA